MRPIQYRDVTRQQLVSRIDDLATIVDTQREQIAELVGVCNLAITTLSRDRVQEARDQTKLDHGVAVRLIRKAIKETKC